MSHHFCGCFHTSCVLERCEAKKLKSKETWRRRADQEEDNNENNNQEKDGEETIEFCRLLLSSSLSLHHPVSSSSSSSSSFSERRPFSLLAGSCHFTIAFSHLRDIAACKFYGYRTFHECRRRFLYGAGSKRSSSSLLSPCFQNSFQEGAADSTALQKLAAWSADRGIFLHPSLRLERFTSDYRDHRFVASDDAVLPYLTPLIVVPAQCLVGFVDATDEDEMQDMLKGTAIAAGVAVQNDMKEQQEQQRKQQQHEKESATSAASSSSSSSSSSLSSSSADICKFFFDTLSLLTNDCLVASSNSSTDLRSVFASSLLCGTRTLKNAPYLSDRDFAVVSRSCPIAEAFRMMVHNFVDSGPLSGKVDRSLLQSAVSLSLSHSLVLPMQLKKSRDTHGKVVRGNSKEKIVKGGKTTTTTKKSTQQEEETKGGGGGVKKQGKVEDDDDEEETLNADGSIGIVPWLHMLPHGGSTLNAVTLAVSAEEAGPVSSWMSLQVPSAGFESPASQRTLKNGFVVLFVCEDIGPGEEVCAQTMAPLNPISTSSSSSAASISPSSSSFSNSSISAAEKKKQQQILLQGTSLVCCSSSSADSSSSSEATSSNNSKNSSRSTSSNNNNKKNNKKTKQQEIELEKQKQEEERQRLLAEQYEIDKEFDETVAMWMVTTASSPFQQHQQKQQQGQKGQKEREETEIVPSAEAKYITSCIYDSVAQEVKTFQAELNTRRKK